MQHGAHDRDDDVTRCNTLPLTHEDVCVMTLTFSSPVPTLRSLPFLYSLPFLSSTRNSTSQSEPLVHLSIYREASRQASLAQLAPVEYSWLSRRHQHRSTTQCHRHVLRSLSLPSPRTAPHRTAPHRTAPHRTAPHRTAPHRTAQHDRTTARQNNQNNIYNNKHTHIIPRACTRVSSRASLTRSTLETHKCCDVICLSLCPSMCVSTWNGEQVCCGRIALQLVCRTILQHRSQHRNWPPQWPQGATVHTMHNVGTEPRQDCGSRCRWRAEEHPTYKSRIVRAPKDRSKDLHWPDVPRRANIPVNRVLPRPDTARERRQQATPMSVGETTVEARIMRGETASAKLEENRAHTSRRSLSLGYDTKPNGMGPAKTAVTSGSQPTDATTHAVPEEQRSAAA